MDKNTLTAPLKYIAHSADSSLCCADDSTENTDYVDPKHPSSEQYEQLVFRSCSEVFLVQQPWLLNTLPFQYLSRVLDAQSVLQILNPSIN